MEAQVISKDWIILTLGMQMGILVLGTRLIVRRVGPTMGIRGITKLLIQPMHVQVHTCACAWTQSPRATLINSSKTKCVQVEIFTTAQRQLWQGAERIA